MPLLKKKTKTKLWKPCSLHLLVGFNDFAIWCFCPHSKVNPVTVGYPLHLYSSQTSSCVCYLLCHSPKSRGIYHQIIVAFHTFAFLIQEISYGKVSHFRNSCKQPMSLAEILACWGILHGRQSVCLSGQPSLSCAGSLPSYSSGRRHVTCKVPTVWAPKERGYNGSSR